VAVTISDNRTTLDQCDSNTNFNTGDPTTTIYAEGSSSITESYGETTGQIYYNGTTPDFTGTGNKLIYLWSFCLATQNGYKEATPADSSHAMWLSDTTNDLLIYMAGNDRDVFKHADGQVQFQSFVIDVDYLDTVDTNGDLAVLAGSYVSFDPTTTSMEVGGHYTTLSKALGGGTNCYIDIIRYGTEGIYIIDGTTGDRGNFAEVAAADRDIVDGAGHGVFREYTPGSYGSQAALKFGTTAAGDSWFDDTGATITYEDRLIADDKYKFVVLGNVTGGEETNFYLSNSTITTARPAVEVDISSTGINVLDLDGINFVGLKKPAAFPTDSASYTHTVTNCQFIDQGQIDPGSVDFTNNLISDYDHSYETAGGAVLIDSASTVGNWSGLSFVSSGTGHAVKVTATGSYTFTGFTYSGYGSTGTTNAAIHNSTAGTVNITVSGGDTPTYYNSGGGTTNVIASVDMTILVKHAQTLAVIQNAQTSIQLLNSPFTQIMNEDTNASGIATEPYTGSTPVDVVVKVRKSETTDDPRYYAVSRIETVQSGTGLSATVLLEENPYI